MRPSAGTSRLARTRGTGFAPLAQTPRRRSDGHSRIKPPTSRHRMPGSSSGAPRPALAHSKMVVAFQVFGRGLPEADLLASEYKPGHDASGRRGRTGSCCPHRHLVEDRVRPTDSTLVRPPHSHPGWRTRPEACGKRSIFPYMVQAWYARDDSLGSVALWACPCLTGNSPGSLGSVAFVAACRQPPAVARRGPVTSSVQQSEGSCSTLVLRGSRCGTGRSFVAWSSARQFDRVANRQHWYEISHPDVYGAVSAKNEIPKLSLALAMLPEDGSGSFAACAPVRRAPTIAIIARMARSFCGWVVAARSSDSAGTRMVTGPLGPLVPKRSSLIEPASDVKSPRSNRLPLRFESTGI